MAHILVVEDDEPVRDLLCEAIRLAGHDADCTVSKAEALQRLAPGSHQLVVSNIRLPDGAGYDVATKATQLGITTVLMSGHPDEVQALAALKAIHLAKPFKLRELQGLIEHHLGVFTEAAARPPERASTAPSRA